MMCEAQPPKAQNNTKCQPSFTLTSAKMLQKILLETQGLKCGDLNVRIVKKILVATAIS